MRRVLTTSLLLAFTSLTAWSQAAKPATPPKRTAAAAGTSAAAGEPTAVFNTTAGTLRCKLFEKETPTTVMNFIGLANGTREWKSPTTHVTKKGVPLYDGTIFHRIIPNFMIQGGDPAGNGTGDPGYKFNDEIVSSLTFDHRRQDRDGQLRPQYQRVTILYYRSTNTPSKRAPHHFWAVR